MIKAGLNVILDGQWGSTGKGKLTGYLGIRYPIDLACSSFGPNAGHTFVPDEGESTICKILSMAGVTAKKPCLIMPDSVISLDRLWKELNFTSAPVYVHPNTAILEESDAKAARETGRRIAGTMQGTGHAISRKLLRLEGVRLAKDVLPKEYICDTCQMVRDKVKEGGTVLLEMSQGFDLSLNHGYEYPYLTSRDITIGAALNSAGAPASMLSTIIGSIRTFPIRVGNIAGGNSGPCYPDHSELSWKDVAEESGGPPTLEEKTTVTKRVRRVFGFSMMQLKKFVEHTDPDALFLNFIQYLDWGLEGVKSKDDILNNEFAHNFVTAIEKEVSVPIWLIGSGAKDSEMVDLLW